MNTTVVEFSNDELKQLLEDPSSCVSVKREVYSLALYPYHLADFNSSIKEILNSKVRKFEKKLGGILLGYKNVKLLTSEGTIVTDTCHIHIDIEADFYIFKPELGSSLKGVVNKKSGDHVGCLVHRLFNVVVPKKDKGDDWIGYLVEIGQEVLVNVIHIDLHSRLPYIKAVIDEEHFVAPEEYKDDENESIQNENYEELITTPITKKKKTKSNINKLIESYEEESTVKDKKKKHKSMEIDEEIVIEKRKEKKKKDKRKSKEFEENNSSITKKNNDEDNESMSKKKKHKLLNNSSEENVIEEYSKLKKKKNKSLDISNNQIEETLKHNELADSKKYENSKLKKKKNKSLEISNNEIEEKLKYNGLDDSKKYYEENSKSKKKKDKSLNNSKNELDSLIQNGFDDFNSKKHDENTKSKKKKNKSEIDEVVDGSPKKKIKKLLHLTQDFNALDNDHVSTPIIKSAKQDTKSKKEKNDSINKTVMADSEDRRKNKKNSEINGNISWEHITLDLHDSDLEKTLGETIVKKKKKKDKHESIEISETKSKKRKREESIEEEVSTKKHKSKKKRHSMELGNQT